MNETPCRVGVNNKVAYHAAGVCGGDAVDYGTPDVEIMACSANWVKVALAAFTSASDDVVVSV